MQGIIVDCGRLADMELLNLTILLLLLNFDLIFSQNNCCNDLTQQCQTECSQQIDCCNQCKSDCTTCCCSSPCAESTNRNCLKSSCTECQSKNNESPCVVPSPDPVMASIPAPAPVVANNSSTIINNNTMVASINITNSVIVENRINVPIKFNNENKNNVQIVFSEAMETQPSEPSEIVQLPEIVEPSEPAITVPTEPSSAPSTCNTTVERVPVFIPIPAAAETAAPTGCCSVMFPCVSQYCPGFRNVCSERCSHRYMYAPVDPCAGGCYRRNYAFGTYCNSNDECRFGLKDCSRCDRGFYMEYRSYRQCSGCFYV